jgi:WD40 repeat protein
MWHRIASGPSGSIDRSKPIESRSDCGSKGHRAEVGKVFRDEEELKSSADLSAEIKSALERSQFLIVVCSPRTPSSKWIDAEVQFFIDRGRRDRVLLLLTDGEPADAFPPALGTSTSAADDQVLNRPTPLAADVRPVVGDRLSIRKRYALLRLIAAIVDCEFDELRLRDQERRARLAVLSSAVLLVILGIIASLGAVAYLRGQETRNLLAMSYWREARNRMAEPEAYLLLMAKAEGAAADSRLANKIGFDQASRYPAYNLVKLIADREVNTRTAAPANNWVRQLNLTGTGAGSIVSNAETTVAAIVSPNRVTVTDTRKNTAGIRSIEHLRVVGAHLVRDGSILVTFGNDEVRIWRTSDASPIGPPIHYDHALGNPLANDNRLITGAGGEVIVWNLDGTIHRRLPNPNKNRIVSCLGARQVLTQTGFKVQAYHTDNLRPVGPAIDVRRNDSIVLLCDTSHMLRINSDVIDLINTTSGTTVSHLPAEDYVVDSTERRLLTWSGDTARLTLLAADPSRPLLFPHAVPIREARFFANQGVAIFGGDVTQMWMVDPMRHVPVPLRRFVGSKVTISNDANTLYSFARDGRIHRWNGVTGASEGDAMVHGDALLEVVKLASGEAVVSMDDERAIFWNAATGARLGSVVMHSRGRTAYDEDEDDRRIRNPLPMINVAGDRAVTWTENGTALLHALLPSIRGPEFERVAEIGKPSDGVGEIDGALFDPSGSQLIVWSNDGYLEVWDVHGAVQQGARLRHNGAIRWAEFVNRGEYLITYDSSDSVRIFTQSEFHRLHQPVRFIAGNDPSDRVVLPERCVVVDIDRDGRLVWQHFRSGAKIRESMNNARAVTTCCNGSLLVTGQTWLARLDIASGRPIGPTIDLGEGLGGVAADATSGVVAYSRQGDILALRYSRSNTTRRVHGRPNRARSADQCRREVYRRQWRDTVQLSRSRRSMPDDTCWFRSPSRCPS